MEVDRVVAEYRRRDRALAQRYEIDALDQVARRQALEWHLASFARRAELRFGELNVLDVGCGRGDLLPAFLSLGVPLSQIAGIDAVPERLDTARQRFGEGGAPDLRHGDAKSLPWESGSFDLVFQSMVFSSLLDTGSRRVVAGEMRRVVRPGGFIIWNDFFVPSPRNRSIRSVQRKEVEALFADFEVRVARRVGVAPPILRRLSGWSRMLPAAVEALQILNVQWFFVLQSPPRHR